jgi:hypothetical protein
MHHNGLFGSAQIGHGTRFADWIDLATPFAVLLPLLGFMWSQRPPARFWVVAAVGSILYVEGHGIHLSANSIGNVAEASDAIHLWDEVVGHYAWYLGLAVVVAACAASARERDLHIPMAALVAGGALCGLTWATNGLEGGTAVASLAVAVGALVPTIRGHRGLAAALAAAGATASLILVAYGIRHGGFPQPSSL